MTSSAVEHQVSVHPFVRGMAPEHIATIASCSEPVRFDSGSFIFHAGESADYFYLIRTGLVSLEVSRDELHPQTIQTLSEGEALGWSWRFEPYRWIFDARAQTPVQAISIDASRLRELCAEDHALGYELMLRISEVIVGRLQATRTQVLNLSSPS